MLGLRPGRAASVGNRPVGDKQIAGGRRGGGRSMWEGEEELDRFGRAEPGLWGDWSLSSSE